ncbi:MAG: rhomboid family intramembrane serine protease [Bacteroidota bacterium]
MDGDFRVLLKKAWPVVGLVIVLWGIHLFQWMTDGGLTFLGVYPRKVSGLIGILTAPLIHGSWGHLASNSVPLLVLGATLSVFFPKIAGRVWLVSWLATGLWVWIAARNSYHIGASGVVFALAFFLFFQGIFNRNVKTLTISLIVAFLYGGLVWQVLPIQEGVSWESHLFGGVAGVILAWFFRKSGPKKKTYGWETEEERPEDRYDSWNYKEMFPPPEGFGYPEE